MQPVKYGASEKKGLQHPWGGGWEGGGSRPQLLVCITYCLGDITLPFVLRRLERVCPSLRGCGCCGRFLMRVGDDKVYRTSLVVDPRIPRRVLSEHKFVNGCLLPSYVGRCLSFVYNGENGLTYVVYFRPNFHVYSLLLQMGYKKMWQFDPRWGSVQILHKENWQGPAIGCIGLC